MLAVTFWRALYGLLLVIARPWVSVRLRLRARSEPEYGDRIQERFGRISSNLPVGPIWFHTVSAGETIAAAPLIETLIAEFPQAPFLVTTMTPTGSAQVAKLLGHRVSHCYAPYDFPASINRFFDRVAPRLLILMETELWPNMLDGAEARGIPALLVNARLSERSARGYGLARSLTRRMLRSLNLIACQYPAHAERFLTLGASPKKLKVIGSVKFDVALPLDHGERVAELKARWQLDERPVWIAGSTHPGEEATVLAAHRLIREQFPDTLLILVPRHPNRREAVEVLIDRANLSQGRMSDGIDLGSCDVILGDTMGELLYLYGLSDVAFLGGSLVPAGGHNPIEAAVCGQPLVMGPEIFNFPDVAAAFLEAGCLTLVNDAAELAKVVVGCLGDPEGRRRTAQQAAQIVADNTGSTQRLVELLRAEVSAVLRPESEIRPRPSNLS